MKKRIIVGMLFGAALITAAAVSPVYAEEATVEVTIVEPATAEETATEDTTLNAPDTGALTILGKEFSQQDFTTLIIATIMIIACGVTAIFSYRTNKKGGQND